MRVNKINKNWNNPLFVSESGIGFYSVEPITNYDRRPYKTQQQVQEDIGENDDKYLDEDDYLRAISELKEINHQDSVWCISLFNNMDDKKAFPMVEHFLTEPIHKTFVEVCDPYFQFESDHEKLRTIISDMVAKAMEHAERWLELNKKFTYYRFPKFLDYIYVGRLWNLFTIINDIQFTKEIQKKVEGYIRFILSNGRLGVKTATYMTGLSEWKNGCKYAVEQISDYQKILDYLTENPNTIKSTIYKKAGVSGRELKYLMKTAIEFKQIIVSLNSKGKEVISLPENS